MGVVQQEVFGNGRQYEIFNVKAGQWYRLRVSVVDRLALPQDLVFTDGCQVHKVASDGVWHSSVPGPEESVFSLTGASRADFAIKCPTPQETINVLWANKVVAIVDIGDMEPNPFIMTTWEPIRPFSLSGIASADVPSENTFKITVQRETLNDLEWNPNAALTDIAWNEVHEWEISDTTDHPFHLHLYHMLIVTPGGCGAHKEGEFYDTISGPACTVRFKTADIGQMCVMHCHVMPHSDSGAMGWVNVQGDGMPNYVVDSPEYMCLNAPGTDTPLDLPRSVQCDADDYGLHDLEEAQITYEYKINFLEDSSIDDMLKELEATILSALAVNDGVMGCLMERRLKALTSNTRRRLVGALKISSDPPDTIKDDRGT